MTTIIQAFFANLKVEIINNKKDFFFKIIFTSFILSFAIWWQNTLSMFTDISALNIPVGDILFVIIPKYDLSLIYFLGMWILFPLGIGYAIYKIPEKIPFVIFSFALFFFIRGICISSTYIGIPPDHITPYLNIPSFFNLHLNIFSLVQFFRNDLFFSGHTGIPFLISLFFWDFKIFRNIFIIISIVMAVTVISMRIHYSIDIIGAYFITYGIFKTSVVAYAKIEKILKV
ncbi:TPA: hypothetical protein EYG96_03325 [Candidatus Gracilibacteria bacterium]|nr:hypothetical protein [Candidatus Gracilibacteria bacterium]HIQ57222.1 hypothetical protein [Candidatus Gracilibacteria bacterium]